MSVLRSTGARCEGLPCEVSPISKFKKTDCPVLEQSANLVLGKRDNEIKSINLSSIINEYSVKNNEFLSSNSTKNKESLKESTNYSPPRVSLHEHIILDIVLNSSSINQRTYGMVDSGAQASYIDQSFAESLKLSLKPKAIPVDLLTVDGSPIITGPVVMECSVILKINDHSENITLDVTKLGHYPVILGIPWLKIHDPKIVWSKNHLLFTSDFVSVIVSLEVL